MHAAPSWPISLSAFAQICQADAYYASYSAELMKPQERALQTYQEVMLPLLEAATPTFATPNVPDAFALEISHHVRKKMLAVSSEGFENVVLILPGTSALRLMTATSAQAKQAAISEGEARPLSF